MEKQRKRRRKPPQLDPLYTLVLRPADYDRIRYIANLPYLTAPLLARLLGKPDHQYQLRRLPRLAAGRYIKYYTPSNGPRLPLEWPDFFMVDDLGRDEARAFIDHRDPPNEIHDGAEPEPTVDHSTSLYHDFATTNTIASIAIDYMETYGRQPRFWSTIKQRFASPEALLRIQVGDAHVVPDGIIALPYPNGKVSIFNTEIIRSQNTKTVLHKLRLYQQIHQQRLYTTQLGLPNMRTLLIFPTVTLMERLKKAALKTLGPTNQFLLTAVPMHKFHPYEHMVTRDWHQIGGEPRPLVIE